MVSRYVLVVPPPFAPESVWHDLWRNLKESLSSQLDQTYVGDVSVAQWRPANVEDVFQRALTRPDLPLETVDRGIHGLLDQLPHHRAYFLDVICLTDKVMLILLTLYSQLTYII